jgi:hypothetical protein
MVTTVKDVVDDEQGVMTVSVHNVSVMSLVRETQTLPFIDIVASSKQTGSIMELISRSRCGDPVLFEYGDAADNCKLLDLHTLHILCALKKGIVRHCHQWDHYSARHVVYFIDERHTWCSLYKSFEKHGKCFDGCEKQDSGVEAYHKVG